MIHEQKIKSTLNHEELEIWNLTFELLDKSILEPIDLISLRDYCKEKNRYYKLFAAVDKLKDNGIIEANKGQRYADPLIGMANKKKEMCEKIEHKFGFDPLGRKKNGYESKPKNEGKETPLSKLRKPGLKKAE